MTIDPQSLRDFAESYTAAWCSGDAASVAAFFAPNGSLRVNDDAAVGREAITVRGAGVHGCFSRPEGAHGRPRRGRRPGRLPVDSCRHEHRAGCTGHGVRISEFEEWRIGADGFIAESLGHFDSKDYRRQLDDGE
jgi:hypothetical protein